MKNKTVAILLTLAMALSMAACGNGKEAEESKEPANESSKVEESKEERKEAVQEPRLIKLIGNKTIPKVYTENDIELADYAENARVQIFLEMLAEKNITLEFEPIANEQFDTTIQTRLSSGKDMPDFFCFNAAQADIINYGRNGILLDIGKVIDEYDEDGSIKAFWSKYYPNLMPSYCTPAGEMYSIPNNVGITVFSDIENYTGNPYSVNLRKDWLDELGIEYKTVITVEELKDILVQFREKDANGNELEDEVLPIDLSAYNVLSYAFGISTEYNVNADAYVNMWHQEEELKAYITYMQELLEAGVIETAGMNGGDYKNNVLAENRASGVVDFTMGTWNAPIVPDEDCLFVPVYVVAEGFDSGMGMYGRQAGAYGNFVIPASCTDVEAVIDLLDLMCTEEIAFLSQYGREGIDYAYNEVSGDPEAITSSPDYAPTFKECLGNALPIITLSKSSKEGIRNTSWAPQVKNDFWVWTLENPDKFVIWSKDFKLPTATDEEQAVYDEFQTELDTYQKEVLTKLILGELSLDDYADYIKQMDALGMADIAAANESRLERYRNLR